MNDETVEICTQLKRLADNTEYLVDHLEAININLHGIYSCMKK